MILDGNDQFNNPMIEALPEPAFAFDAGGHFLFCNAAARDILKLLGYSMHKNPEHHDAFVQILRFSGARALEGKAYDIASRPYEGGILLRLMPRVEDEHLLRLSASLDIMPWGLLTVDMCSDKPVCAFSNPKVGDFLGIPYRDLIGMPMPSVFKKFGFDEKVIASLCGKKANYHDHEFQKDGRISWYRFHFIHYETPCPYCLIVIEDTTEEKIKEGQYFQAQRLESLGKLAGGVAHDFNNILSIIDGYARIGKKLVAPEDTAFDYFEQIKMAVQRGASLTNRLLTFGQHKIIKDSVFDLGQLARDQESLLRPLLDESISLSILGEENIFVAGHPDNICQILLNLCINSRDAIPDGGAITIECGKTRNNRAFLRVTDTGTGIPPEIKAKIFDPFFTTKAQGKGTGLGLSMVYGLVKDMRGEIDVVSKDGEGTVFTIILPLSEKSAASHRIIEDENGNIHLEGFTALIAEDEPALLDLVSKMVEEMGVRVLKATNGNEALIVQEDYEGDIDFLLTDVVMPELNGVRLAELFGSVRPESKIMFMSGYPESGDMAPVSLPDKAYFIPKPVDFQKLGAILKNITAKKNDDIRENWKDIVDQGKIAF